MTKDKHIPRLPWKMSWIQETHPADWIILKSLRNMGKAPEEVRDAFEHFTSTYKENTGEEFSKSDFLKSIQSLLHSKKAQDLHDRFGSMTVANLNQLLSLIELMPEKKARNRNEKGSQWAK